MGILGTGIQEGLLLKPVRYQWAMDLYEQAVANTWFPNEIQLGEDIADFKRMTDEERHAVTFLMSYFNPSELLVNKALAFGVYPYVNAPEAHLYLAKQMWEEANHCMSFEYVLETFPIDREEAFFCEAFVRLGRATHFFRASDLQNRQTHILCEVVQIQMTDVLSSQVSTEPLVTVLHHLRWGGGGRVCGADALERATMPSPSTNSMPHPATSYQ